MNFKIGLTWRILAPITLLFIILMSTLTYVSYQQSADALKQATIDNMGGEANSLKRIITYIINESKAALLGYSLEPELQNLFRFSDVSNIEKYEIDAANTWLKQQAERQTLIARINVFNVDGDIVASSMASAVGKNFKTREYFTEAMSGKNFLSKPFKSGINGNAVFVSSVPLKVDGKIVGALSSVILLQSIYELAFKDVKIYERGYAYAVNAEGMLLIHKDSNMLFKDDLPAVPEYKRMATLPDGTASFINAQGEPSFTYFIKEPQTDMTLIVQAEEKDAFAALEAIAKNMLLIASIGCILGVILLLLLVIPIVRALKRGMRYAKEIAAGNLKARLGVRRSDEIGMLADALRAIPITLNNIILEYKTIEQNISQGIIDTKGDASKFSGSFSDLITGTNAILGRFQGIMNMFSNPMAIFDKNLHITYINNMAKSIVGNEYVGKTCMELMAREDFGTGKDALKIAAETLNPATAETIAHPNNMNIDIRYSTVPFKDEKGKLSFVMMDITDITDIKNAQRTMLEVADKAQDISNNVATASANLAQNVGTVSLGADIQCERATSTATAMEEMNLTVLEVSRNAGEAHQQAGFVRIKANEGAAVVNQVVDAIVRVNTVSTELEKDMQQLGEQANNIGGIMNVISDIADQTNLLALNAAIEAARAGEAGRGFAVVADEVRKLAEKTMIATTQVESSIKGIQKSTSINITRVSEAAIGIAEASTLATSSGQVLEDILDLVNTNSALISGIATAAEEQSATSDEINTSVEEINKIALETAEGMTQANASVQELSKMAKDLLYVIERLQARR